MKIEYCFYKESFSDTNLQTANIHDKSGIRAENLGLAVSAPAIVEVLRQESNKDLQIHNPVHYFCATAAGSCDVSKVWVTFR